MLTFSFVVVVVVDLPQSCCRIVSVPHFLICVRKIKRLEDSLAQATQQSKMYKDELAGLKRTASQLNEGGGSTDDATVNKLRVDLSISVGKSNMLADNISELERELSNLKSVSIADLASHDCAPTYFIGQSTAINCCLLRFL